MNQPATQHGRKPTYFIYMISVTMTVLVSILILLSMAWGAFALWYQLPFTSFFKIISIVVWCCILLAASVLLWREQGKLGIGIWLLACALFLIWWSTLTPSNDRIWADDVARQLSGEVSNNVVTLHNVRNFDWY